VKVFADGADRESMLRLRDNPLIKGFTTNPTLMRKAGVTSYAEFAREMVALIPDRPISFEVFADEFDAIERQAVEVASWGENVYVKVPVMNTRGESTRSVVRRLATAGLRLNVTAVMTLEQVRWAADWLDASPSSYVSVFAGRIADTGRDPVPIIAAAVRALSAHPQLELIWASPRELLNVFQANAAGCHIITVTHDLLAKIPVVGRDLGDFSLETVRMFRSDALAAGFELDSEVPELAL
jgi:transaldolase